MLLPLGRTDCAVKIYPGGRRELRSYIDLGDISTVGTAIARLKRGEAVYVWPSHVPELLERWQSGDVDQ